MAEGGGLLNRYRVKSSIGGSNPPLSATPLDRSLRFPQGQQIHEFLTNPRGYTAAGCAEVQPSGELT